MYVLLVKRFRGGRRGWLRARGRQGAGDGVAAGRLHARHRCQLGVGTGEAELFRPLVAAMPVVQVISVVLGVSFVESYYSISNCVSIVLVIVVAVLQE